MSSAEKLIVIGGSAGGLNALFRIFEGLSLTLNTPILLVLHRINSIESTLQELLMSKTHYKVNEIEEKEPIMSGNLYICPPDYHVLLEDDHSFSLDVSEKVNYCRPSLDVVFKSASAVYTHNLTAVLLSGGNADGAEGLKVVKANGGTTIVQDPLDAQIHYMPEKAIQYSPPDFILNCEEISKLLNS